MNWYGHKNKKKIKSSTSKNIYVSLFHSRCVAFLVSNKRLRGWNEHWATANRDSYTIRNMTTKYPTDEFLNMKTVHRLIVLRWKRKGVHQNLLSFYRWIDRFWSGTAIQWQIDYLGIFLAFENDKLYFKRKSKSFGLIKVQKKQRFSNSGIFQNHSKNNQKKSWNGQNVYNSRSKVPGNSPKITIKNWMKNHKDSKTTE